jgi:hypothetical protein
MQKKVLPRGVIDLHGRAFVMLPPAFEGFGQIVGERGRDPEDEKGDNGRKTSKSLG